MKHGNKAEQTGIGCADGLLGRKADSVSKHLHTEFEVEEGCLAERDDSHKGVCSWEKQIVDETGNPRCRAGS